MGRLFGTDGVRGIANKELTPELAFHLGKASATVLKKGNKSPVFLIGMDTRISGHLLEHAITSGILAVGGKVIKVGVIPTPAVAHLVKAYNADAGVVISASHNPFEYNGIKFFNGKGFKLDDLIEEEIEDLVLSGIDQGEHKTGMEIGTCFSEMDKAKKLYEAFLISTAPSSLEGFKVVLDCANGAAYEVAPNVFKKLGADVTVIGDKPDGTNINQAIGSTHPEKLQATVLKVGADLGLAYDGDADRLIVVDEAGRIIDGDKIICLCAKYLKEKGRLTGDLVTGTVMSNLGFHKYLEKLGVVTQSTKVGDRYVLEAMLKTNSVIGGEQSGHIIFLEHTTTGDGILSSLQFINAMMHWKKKASELSKEVTLYPQVLENAKVSKRGQKLYEQDEIIMEEIAKINEVLGDDGRLLIRPSGTEPLVRVMIEGENLEKIAAMAKSLAELIEERFRD